MNENEILKTVQDFKEILENDLLQRQTANKKTEIKDIKFVGKLSFKDKVNGNSITENVFIVEKQIIEKLENGEERITEQQSYYLGDRCIGGKIGDSEIIYDEHFQQFEQDKVKVVEKLLKETSEEEIENNSLKRLENQEKDEQKEMTIDENRSKKQENKLTKKQTEKIKVNGIQKVDLNKLVDGKETLGKRLDLEEYDEMYVIYSENVDEITSGIKRNNTTYSLVGVKNDGEAKILNDEFEMDRTVGNSANRNQTKIKANSTATRDSKDLSVYTRKSNGMSIGCENDKGNVDMYLYQKTLEENENVGIQIETSKTPVIPHNVKEIMNRNKGIYYKEKVQNEIEEHTEEGCNPEDIKDFDGDKNTSTHEHIEDRDLEQYVLEIHNYENKEGEEKIKEIFTENEIQDKLLRELEKSGDEISIEQLVENLKEEMNQDAEILSRVHKR